MDFLLALLHAAKATVFPGPPPLSSCVGMAVLKMVTYLAALTHFDSWSGAWLYKPRRSCITKLRLSEPCQGIIIIPYCFTTRLANLWLLFLFDFIFYPDFKVENTGLEDLLGLWVLGFLQKMERNHSTVRQRTDP